MSIRTLFDGRVLESGLATLLADLLDRVRRVEGLAEELLLTFVRVARVGLHDLLELLLGPGTHQIADDQRTLGLEDAPRLSEEQDRLGDMVEDRVAEHPIEGVVAERSLLGVRLDQPDATTVTRLRNLESGDLEHLLAEIDARHGDVGVSFGKEQWDVAGTGSEIQEITAQAVVLLQGLDEGEVGLGVVHGRVLPSLLGCVHALMFWDALQHAVSLIGITVGTTSFLRAMRNTMLLLPLLPLLLLQSPGKSPAATLYERGRHDLEADRKEDAARSFRMARQLCLRDAPKGDNPNLLALIAEALPEADSLDKDRTRLMQSIARSLVSVASRYIDKGWTRTAEQYLRTAKPLDPGVGARERARSKTDGPRAKEPAAIHGFFPDLRSVWKLQGWERKAEQIVAPQSNKDESTTILHPRSLEPGYRVQVEIAIPDRISRGGIYFAFKGRQEFHYLELGYDKDNALYLELYLRANQQFEKLDSFAIDQKLVAGKAWIPLVLEVRNEEIAFALAGRPLWANVQPGRSLSGKVGLSATCLPQSVGSISFRSFEHRVLPRIVGKTEETYTSLSRRLQDAMQLAETDRHEEAALEMARVLDLAVGIHDSKERRQLQKATEKALKKCDKDHATAARARSSASRKLLALADRYHKKDWNASARRLAVLADELQPGSAAKLLSKLPPRRLPGTREAAALLQGKPSQPKDKPWSLEKGDLRSSALPPGTDTWLLFSGAPTRDWKASCKVHPGQAGGQVGLLFAHRAETTFHRLRIDCDGASLGMHLESREGKVIRPLYSVRIALARGEPDEGIPLVVGMTGQTLTIGLGRLQPRVFDLPLDCTVGHLGLWAGNRGERPFRAVFASPKVSR